MADNEQDQPHQDQPPPPRLSPLMEAALRLCGAACWDGLEAYLGPRVAFVLPILACFLEGMYGEYL